MREWGFGGFRVHTEELYGAKQRKAWHYPERRRNWDKGPDVKWNMILNTRESTQETPFHHYDIGETMPHETDQATPAS